VPGGSFCATRRSLPDKPDELSLEVICVSMVCVAASFCGRGVPFRTPRRPEFSTPDAQRALLLATVRFHPALAQA
jgi:hypothetical protein